MSLAPARRLPLDTRSTEETPVRQIFVNLPVADVTASRAFFTGLSLTVNEMFSDDSNVALKAADNITFMMLRKDRFAEFCNAGVSDAHTAQEVLLCLSCDSAEEVDALVEKAVATGGKPWKPAIDSGPMHGGSFQDPDGHVWELVHMPA